MRRKGKKDMLKTKRQKNKNLKGKNIKKINTKFLIKIILVIGIIVVAALIIVDVQSKTLGYNSAREFLKDKIIGEDGKVETVTEATLEKVVKTSKLYTVEYPYNGYVTVYDEKNGKEKYNVAYKGSVQAGIDISKIEVTLDEDNKIIDIQLPEVEVDEPYVDVGSLEFMFFKDKYDTETVAQEAYKAAIEDLSNRIGNDSEIIQTATESAKTTEKALVEPWVNQVDENIKYEVRVWGYMEKK